MLSSLFVPVAVDEWYHVRRKDQEGEFYRHVVYQRDGMHPGRTTQGLYVFDAEGTMWKGWNNRDPDKLRRYLADCSQVRFGDSELPKGWTGPVEKAFVDGPGAEGETDDARYDRAVPVKAAVVDVFTRVLDGAQRPQSDRWQKIFGAATGRDHLWILGEEVEALRRGEFPERLLRRIVRFHLVDDTRGEPPLWRADEVRRLRRLEVDESNLFRAEVELVSADEERTYSAQIRGVWECHEDVLTRFDVAVQGTFEGHGRWTSNAAPSGPFPLGIAFTLADPDRPASQVPPQAARDRGGYLRAD